MYFILGSDKNYLKCNILHSINLKCEVIYDTNMVTVRRKTEFIVLLAYKECMELICGSYFG